MLGGGELICGTAPTRHCWKADLRGGVSFSGQDLGAD